MAIISIDYDDTIVYADYPNIGVIKPFAALVINQLYSEGHTIIINTCRSGEHETAAAQYLTDKGVKFHHINENHPDNIAQYDSDSRKIFADVYIDDKQLGGLPDNWMTIYEVLHEQLKRVK
jgi:hydroxymethylpyrimidine pyrophosphatase-like HAD family hydrolase